MAQETTCEANAEALDQIFDKFATESKTLVADLSPKLANIVSTVSSVPQTDKAAIDRSFREGIRSLNLPANKIFATALVTSDTNILSACVQNIFLKNIPPEFPNGNRVAVELNFTLCASPEESTIGYHGGIVKYYSENKMSIIEPVRAENRNVRIFESANPEFKEGLQKILKLECN